jgi:hypothetical protein
VSRTTVIPRDLRPGDRVDRVDLDLNVVQATVREVKKVSRFGSTAYKVYLEEQADVPEGQRGWAEHRHLSPFVLMPRARVAVEREARP